KENKNKYNIVHIHTPNVAFIVAPIAKKNGIKIIIGHSHATKYSDKILSKLRNFILLANRNYYFTNICGCSSEALRFLSRFTIKKNKFIIKNAIDISKFKFNHGHRKIFREEFKIKENQILVGCIGRFNNQKNQKFLLDVFYDLKKNNEFHLILIGSGPNKKNIEEYIKRKKMHNVTITDPRDDIYKIYSALDILVLPSKFEGLPMVAVEGLASGLPVILSNKITKDLLCKQTTYLSINNYKFWSEAISNTNLSNYREREKANILEELNYDIKKEQSNLIEYYEQLIYGGGIDGK
ncbi:TPA: glycosyltransferase family 1 protein, partial [Enterococcus faecium]|nr:glycosyltransferase family 1 protein [Enterococcus faecium]